MKKRGEKMNGWLLGWKDIGSYLGCSDKQAQKYFKGHGLPIQKMPTKRYFKASASPEELDKWMKKFSKCKNV